jgi:hypothetical protein
MGGCERRWSAAERSEEHVAASSFGKRSSATARVRRLPPPRATGFRAQQDNAKCRCCRRRPRIRAIAWTIAARAIRSDLEGGAGSGSGTGEITRGTPASARFGAR